MSKHPTISVVVPSFNNVRFLEETLNSIFTQDYSKIECIVIDGGSTDGTIEIIKKYSKYIKYWISESDAGMYDAINKGFERTSGEIMCWSPASDLYEKDAFSTVASVFTQFQYIDWLTSQYKVKCSENSKKIARYKIKGFNKNAFLKGRYCLGLPGAEYNIQQQSTFWRRSLWTKAGGYIDSNFKAAGDFELWARFYKFSDLYSINKAIGIFRTHTDQVSGQANNQYLKESFDIFKNYNGRPYCSIELLLRNHIFNRSLFNFIIYIPFIRYSANIVNWDSTQAKWHITKKYFI